MALKAIRKDLIVRHVSSLDPARHGKDETGAFKLLTVEEGIANGGTVFLVGAISSRVQAYIKDNSVKFRADPEDPTKMVSDFGGNNANLETVKYGLKGIEGAGLLDANDRPVEFKTYAKVLGGIPHDGASEDILDMIGIEVIRELSEVIVALNAVSVADAKN